MRRPRRVVQHGLEEDLEQEGDPHPVAGRQLLLRRAAGGAAEQDVVEGHKFQIPRHALLQEQLVECVWREAVPEPHVRHLVTDEARNAPPTRPARHQVAHRKEIYVECDAPEVLQADPSVRLDAKQVQLGEGIWHTAAVAETTAESVLEVAKRRHADLMRKPETRPTTVGHPCRNIYGPPALRTPWRVGRDGHLHAPTQGAKMADVEPIGIARQPRSRLEHHHTVLALVRRCAGARIGDGPPCHGLHTWRNGRRGAVGTRLALLLAVDVVAAPRILAFHLAAPLAVLLAC
mmetsp:Transcript_38077/g.108728  ORF Transcript_38077/g.108728 Transcript_38077/m.108728 type:complete len:290 (-) Transcript_38077:24-893(-)